MSTALVWFRRDLRIADNAALHAACERHSHVLPVYVHAPNEEAPWSPGGASRWWLHHSLQALSEALAALGAPLVVVHGPTLDALRKLVRATYARAVYWNHLYDPAIVTRDRIVKEALQGDGLDASSFNAALLAEPWQVRAGSNAPFRVFTPFWRVASANLDALPAPLPAPKRLRPPQPIPQGVPLQALDLLPTFAWDSGLRSSWHAGEAGAARRLECFCSEAVADYREQRDHPAREGTSRLSPHLHFGEIGPRQVVWRLRQLTAENGGAANGSQVDHYLRELGWREFAHHLLYHFPHTTDAPLDQRFAEFPWRKPRDYAADLRAWQRGQTGIPIVDAGMRELWSTGWMHNRVRMIVASLLTKNLLVPWQEGARWFWDTLVDADLANNTLGWQWTAGCGADAAPWFRIFNPVLQSGKFDAAAYLRRWVPELAGLADADIHAPWAAKPAALGGGYPDPIVSLPQSRERALAAYRQIKADAE